MSVASARPSGIGKSANPVGRHAGQRLPHPAGPVDPQTASFRHYCAADAIILLWPPPRPGAPEYMVPYTATIADAMCGVCTGYQSARFKQRGAGTGTGLCAPGATCFTSSAHASAWEPLGRVAACLALESQVTNWQLARSATSADGLCVWNGSSSNGGSCAVAPQQLESGCRPWIWSDALVGRRLTRDGHVTSCYLCLRGNSPGVDYSKQKQDYMAVAHMGRTWRPRI